MEGVFCLNHGTLLEIAQLIFIFIYSFTSNGKYPSEANLPFMIAPVYFNCFFSEIQHLTFDNLLNVIVLLLYRYCYFAMQQFVSFLNKLTDIIKVFSIIFQTQLKK